MASKITRSNPSHRLIFHSFWLLLIFCQCTFANGGHLPRKSTAQKHQPDNAQDVVKHIKDFGATGDGVTNCTDAFQKASAYLQANGGTLIIDAGTYIVGKQTQAGRYTAGYSFLAAPIISIKDVQNPVIIKGENATIKAADGLKYGYFNPVSGEKDSIRKEGNKSAYVASAYTFIHAQGCASVTIIGLTLDGNSGKLDIGPSYDQVGIQFMATGIGMYNNKQVDIENCNIHHCGLDGIIIAWDGLKDTDPAYPHTIKNVKATYNGRQGISWVGGNNLTVINSEFSSTGKALNNGVPVVSKPSAGIDIEIEHSIIKNGNFINCVVNDNSGPGISSIGHDTYDIHFSNVTFIGTTNSAAYPKTQGLSFDSCIFVGKVERLFGSADKSKAVSFKDCLFTMDEKKSPSGKVFGDYSEFYGAPNVTFENCEFDAGTRRLPVFNNKEILFSNCKFRQNNNSNFKASAIFKGNTQFDMKGAGKIDAGESNFEGKVMYNNKGVTDLKNARFN